MATHGSVATDAATRCSGDRSNPPRGGRQDDAAQVGVSGEHLSQMGTGLLTSRVVLLLGVSEDLASGPQRELKVYGFVQPCTEVDAGRAVTSVADDGPSARTWASSSASLGRDHLRRRLALRRARLNRLGRTRMGRVGRTCSATGHTAVRERAARVATVSGQDQGRRQRHDRCRADGSACGTGNRRGSSRIHASDQGWAADGQSVRPRCIFAARRADLHTSACAESHGPVTATVRCKQ